MFFLVVTYTKQIHDLSTYDFHIKDSENITLTDLKTLQFAAL